jgi:hypothetical protein
VYPDSPGLRAIPLLPCPTPPRGTGNREPGTGARCGEVARSSYRRGLARAVGRSGHSLRCESCCWSSLASSSSPHGGAEALASPGRPSFRWTRVERSPLNIRAGSLPRRAGTRLSGRFQEPVHERAWLAKALQKRPSGAAKSGRRRPHGPSVKSRERYRRAWQGSTPPSPPRGGRTYPLVLETRK